MIFDVVLALLVSTIRACEGLYSVERVTGLAPRFFVHIVQSIYLNTAILEPIGTYLYIV